MKANELRIGNLVSDGNFQYKIGEISFDIIRGFTTLNGKDIYPDSLYSLNIENLQGIPLTEEWLLKLGFKQEDIQKYADNRPLQKEYCKKDLMMVRFQSNRFYAAPFGFPINVNKTLYVHQLQNLYFALTGEELTLNEKL